MEDLPYVYILGVDELHQEHLYQIKEKKKADYRLDLTWELNYFKHSYDRHTISKITQELCQHIEKNAHKKIGIVAYWDFPTTLLRGLLVSKYQLDGSNYESVFKCEHKLWSRIEQTKSIPGNIPHFVGFDPFQDDISVLSDLNFPFWIKPIKSCSSQFAYRIESYQDAQNALEEIRLGTRDIYNSMQFFMEHLQDISMLPFASQEFCIAEEALKGNQYTVEGFKWRGLTFIHGIFDNYNDKSDRSFVSYQYPSILPEKVQGEMCSISTQIMDYLGYDNAPFNIEFFYDQASEVIRLLEINPRISQSHTLPLNWVDGFSNIELSCDIAAGIAPHPTFRQGPYKKAGKFYLRHYEDKVVNRIPSNEELTGLRHQFSSPAIKIPVRQGQKLSELGHQDSYSYELALFYLGANSQQELMNKYRDMTTQLKDRFDLTYPS